MFGMIPFERQNNNMLDLFDQFDHSFFDSSASSLSAFRTDIKDQGDSYLMEAELPGFNKEDIHLDLKDNLLTITASHNSESEEKDENAHYVRRERRIGSFSRTFDVSGIDEDHITAAYNNGVLSLTFPKASAVIPQPRRIDIQ